jgi:hypothetical protein
MIAKRPTPGISADTHIVPPRAEFAQMRAERSRSYCRARLVALR